MSSTEAGGSAATSSTEAGVGMKLEVVVIPVSDVDRAKSFYTGLGWRLDADIADDKGFRIVQLNPPGSQCSVQFGAGVTAIPPGSSRDQYLVVPDIEAVRMELVARGVEVSEVFHEASPGGRFHSDGRVSGAAPDHRTYGSFASFSDPDGNSWLLQEITSRLPGRVDAAPTTFASTSDLASALRRAAAAHGEHERRIGAADPNWPDWYAAYMVAEAGGTELHVTLAGKTVLVIGGSGGIGLETARLAHAEGADLILTGRNTDRLQQAGLEVGASIAAFDATDFDRLGTFFAGLPKPIDHVLVTGPGPYYGLLQDFDLGEARRDIEAHLLLPIEIARHAVGKVRPGGTLLFMSGTGGRRVEPGGSLISALTAAMPALVKNLALEVAPVRVNLIAAGFVDTPLSATILGAGLDARREALRSTLPIRRVIGPADIALLAVQLMTNGAVTGATVDIDGGQQLVEQ